MREIPALFFSLALVFSGHSVNMCDACFGDFQTHDKTIHDSHPWKVHEIAQDFELLDVWEFPISADQKKHQDFFLFLDVMRQPPKNGVAGLFSVRLLIARLLVSLRVYLGETFGLDKNINTLPIPGCRETSLRDRLSAEDRKRSLTDPSEEGAQNTGLWRTVYLYENEMLTELSIDAAHALMHLGWVHKSGNFYTAQLAIYAKPRGDLGKLYMQLIMPFRRLIIYPVMMEDVKNRWEEKVQKPPLPPLDP